MTNFKFSLLFSISLGLLLAWGISALSKDDIVFPVAELGNCQNEQECRAYCDDPAHINECVAFAEKYSLLSGSEIERAKKFQSIGAVGPGGCTSERACQIYCENVSNIEECLAFAEQHGFMEDSELQEAKKIARALQEGARLPGGCTGKDACEEYCSDTSHMKECVEFAEKAGFMSPEELKEAKQVLRALDAGVSFPGNCKGKSECEAYCEDPSHMEECFNFAAAAGFIPEEEIEQARKIMPLMAAGKMPGGCKGKDECETYCSDDANMEECANFAAEAGLMSPEELDMFRKTGGKGPGDCKGREQCEAFCNDPKNQQACFEFGKEHGLISEEDLQNMEEGMEQFREGFESAPPEVADCLQQRIGTEVLQRIEAGTFMPNPELGDHMRSCFEEFMPRPEEGFRQQGGFGPEGEFEFEPGESLPEGFEEFVPEEFREFIPEDTEGFTPQDLEQIIREQQNDRAAACAGEGGVWDGSGCRAPAPSGEFFPDSGFPQGDQFQQVQQQVQQQTERQVQQQILEQQIQEQQRQLQEQLQLLQQQTSPLPPTSTGGNILEAVGNLLRQFLGR